MLWHITKTTYETCNPYVVDTYEGNLTEAMEYCYLTTQEHAERLGVTWLETPQGGYLVTNNGTPVYYRPMIASK